MGEASQVPLIICCACVELTGSPRRGTVERLTRGAMLVRGPAAQSGTLVHGAGHVAAFEKGRRRQQGANKGD